MSIEQKFAELAAAPTWQPGTNYSWLLVRSDGKIIGKVCLGSIGSGCYYAIKGGRHLGEYYTEEQAKRAVEGPSP